MKPLLVTGASGFVGRHLLEANVLRTAPQPMLALVRTADAWRRADWTAALGDVSLVEGSVTEPSSWTQQLPALGGIAHLAAVVQHSRHDPGDMRRVNVDGTLAMVRLAAAQRCRLVVVSTSGTVACFRSADEAADEKSPFCEATVARWPYYASKIEMERRARALADELGVELVFVRPPILLGPGDHRFRSTRNVQKVLERKLPFVVRGGIAFGDVRDAAAALLVALERPDVQPVYHLPGHVCGIEEFFAQIAALSGVPGPRWTLPYGPAHALASLVEGLGARLLGQPPHWLPDPVVVEMAAHHWALRSLYAEADLGYRLRPARDTLDDTITWLRAVKKGAGLDSSTFPIGKS
ncbi:NAD-dependent epimerase/dehydratase family protein [Myxococcota bacterium]|nr:NAD-dependent epimerase/dehydratase family protein [Myxococcota bacterium]